MAPCAFEWVFTFGYNFKMGKKAETLFKEKVTRDLKDISNIWFVKTQEVGRRGTPDILLCVNGIFMAIELKKDQDAPVSPLQEWNLQAIAECNGIGLICWPDNWADSKALIIELATEKNKTKEIIKRSEPSH